MKKYPCPCCEFDTFEGDNEEAILFEYCAICFWQYDPVMHDKSDMTGGANKVSLDEAKVNYQKFGVSEQRFANSLRKPRGDR